MATDKFLQPVDAITVVQKSGAGALLTPEAINAAFERIQNGEDRDAVIAELAFQEVEFENALNDGTIPSLKTAGAAESEIHKLADSQESGFRVALEASFRLAARELEKSHKTDMAVAVLKRALKQTLPTLIRKTLNAGGEFAAGSLKTLRAAKRAESQVKPKFAFDKTNEEAVSWADKHAAELIDGISETSRELINNAIADLLESGDWNDAIDEILAVVKDPDRAARIARNEAMTAVSEGQRQAWRQASDEGLLGDAQRTWITVGDEKVCPICEPLDGKTADLDGEYADGIEGPPAHVMCRCTEGLA